MLPSEGGSCWETRVSSRVKFVCLPVNERHQGVKTERASSQAGQTKDGVSGSSIYGPGFLSSAGTETPLPCNLLPLLRAELPLTDWLPGGSHSFHFILEFGGHHFSNVSDVKVITWKLFHSTHNWIEFKRNEKAQCSFLFKTVMLSSSDFNEGNSLIYDVKTYTLLWLF